MRLDFSQHAGFCYFVECLTVCVLDTGGQSTDSHDQPKALHGRSHLFPVTAGGGGGGAGYPV